jgi:small subunit ribosomal protein S20
LHTRMHRANMAVLEVRKLANIKSAKKRAIQAAKRYARNRMVKSSLRTAIRKFLEASPEEAAVKLSQAFKALDQAASKGVIHKNTAARKKARLAKRLAAIAKAANA